MAASLLVERRHAQATADAAALAAASDLYVNWNSNQGLDSKWYCQEQCPGRSVRQRLHQRRHDVDSHRHHPANSGTSQAWPAMCKWTSPT